MSSKRPRIPPPPPPVDEAALREAEFQETRERRQRRRQRPGSSILAGEPETGPTTGQATILGGTPS